jgi:ABC-type Na+ efflux pump permease subunit
MLASSSTLSAALTIARYALVEARRSTLPWLAGASMLAALALAGFLSQVAITEAAALQASACAALLRACAVFLTVTHAVASVVRESNDKGIELQLALPITRPAWYLGKLLGFAAVGALLALALALPLAAWARPGDLAAWALALAAETATLAAAALFFASALGQTVPAIAATAGFYLLARSMAAVQAIASGPLAGDGGAGEAARALIEALALLLPRLDLVAPGDWLVYGAPAPAQLVAPLAGLAACFLLLTAAGLFDASRRNL